MRGSWRLFAKLSLKLSQPRPFPAILTLTLNNLSLRAILWWAGMSTQIQQQVLTKTQTCYTICKIYIKVELVLAILRSSCGILAGRCQ